MITRIISALVAAALIVGSAYFFKTTGVYVLASIFVVGCIYEFSKLTLRQGEAALSLQVSFILFAIIVYVTTLLRADLSAEVASVVSMIFLAMGVMSIRRAEDLGHTFKLQTVAVLGFFYVGLFPGFAVRLLGLENGLVYFFGLLGIVFAGDTFAYFFGRFLGHTKLLEPVSPKKTRAGSAGGLIGAAIAGGLLAYFFVPNIPVPHMIAVAVLCGAFAQVGDLFESLIKRLADTKDSGRIMPGHGGFLDRLDGVLFAAPVFYVLLHFLGV